MVVGLNDLQGQTPAVGYAGVLDGRGGHHDLQQIRTKVERVNWPLQLCILSKLEYTGVEGGAERDLQQIGTKVERVTFASAAMCVQWSQSTVNFNL